MARRRRRRVDPLRPLTQAELEAQASRLVNSAILQPKQSIRRQQAEARRQAEADAQTIAGFTRALSEIVGSAGQRVEDVYGRATDRQRQIAQGFSQQQQQGDQAAADAANALLAQAGQTRRIDPGTGSQVTYALGGMVPGNLLNETGAAAAAMAHGYGAGVAGRGQRQLQQRQSKAMEEQAKLREAFQELMARVPGLTAEQLDRLYQREISKAATGIQGQYLGLAQGREAFDQTYDMAKLQADINAAGAKNAKDAGKAQAKAREARYKALTSAKTAALSFADELYQGEQVNDPSSISGHRNVVPTWGEAYAKMWNRYGSGLMRYAPRGHKAWWRGQVDAMIVNVLKGAGFTRGRRKGTVADKPRG